MVDTRKLEIKDGKKWMKENRQWLQLEVAMPEAFPNIAAESGRGRGFALAYNMLLRSMAHFWVSKILGPRSDDEVTLKRILSRSLDAIQAFPDITFMRPQHDMLFAQLLVLMRDGDLIKETAPHLRFARSSEDRFSGLLSWAGSIRACLLGDSKDERTQLTILHASRADRTWLWPSRRLLTAFLERDQKAFSRASKQGIERHWEYAARDGALSEQRNGVYLLDLSRKHLHYFWPWPETAFALLFTTTTGWRPSFASVWMPNLWA